MARRKKRKRQHWYPNDRHDQALSRKVYPATKSSSYLSWVVEPQDIEAIAIEVFGATVWSASQTN